MLRQFTLFAIRWDTNQRTAALIDQHSLFEGVANGFRLFRLSAVLAEALNISSSPRCMSPTAFAYFAFRRPFLSPYQDSEELLNVANGFRLFRLSAGFNTVVGSVVRIIVANGFRLFRLSADSWCFHSQ